MGGIRPYIVVFGSKNCTIDSRWFPELKIIVVFNHFALAITRKAIGAFIRSKTAV